MIDAPWGAVIGAAGDLLAILAFIGGAAVLIWKGGQYTRVIEAKLVQVEERIDGGREETCSVGRRLEAGLSEMRQANADQWSEIGKLRNGHRDHEGRIGRIEGRVQGG